MATEETVIVHPGDIIQDSAGQLMLVTQTKKWGVGAVQRWHDGVEMQERYHRLKPGQFVVCGAAHLLPEEISQARRDSLRTAADFAMVHG
jgi:hypothetical protein